MLFYSDCPLRDRREAWGKRRQIRIRCWNPGYMPSSLFVYHCASKITILQRGSGTVRILPFWLISTLKMSPLHTVSHHLCLLLRYVLSEEFKNGAREVWFVLFYLLARCSLSFLLEVWGIALAARPPSQGLSSGCQSWCSPNVAIFMEVVKINH